MPEKMSAEMNYPSQYVDVLGSKLHYVEHGYGDPILFLHTVPASSYAWRNIIPFLAPLGRCIAVDMIGMGKSDKPDIAYTIHDHIRYIEEFIKVKKLKNIMLVMHGWGSVIGFSYAMNHEDNCKGLIFYESFLRPLHGNDLSLPYQVQVKEFQGYIDSTSSISSHNAVNKILMQTMMHGLTDEALKQYSEPFEDNHSAKALKQYLTELPPGDGQSEVDHLIANYSKKLMRSELPKLLLYSVPGFVTTIATIMWAKENLPHLEIGDLDEELHFAQEACPQLMGELMSAWLQAVEQQVAVV